MGTQLELSDKSGKVIGSILLGKIVVKKEAQPAAGQQETPVGRYVLSEGAPTVLAGDVGRAQKRDGQTGNVARQRLFQSRAHQGARC